MEELLADVVCQLVRFPFNNFIIVGYLNTIELEFCLVSGHLLLIELKVWGEEGQLIVYDAIEA